MGGAQRWGAGERGGAKQDTVTTAGVIRQIFASFKLSYKQERRHVSKRNMAKRKIHIVRENSISTMTAGGKRVGGESQHASMHDEEGNL